MGPDEFTDATGDGTTAEVCEDGETVNLTVGGVTIALTADDARDLAEALRTYAESL